MNAVPRDRPISERELLAFRAEFRNNLFRQIHRRMRGLKATGLTQRRIATRLGMDPGQLSKVLNGEKDIRLETLSDLARALGCRISTSLSPIEQPHLVQANITTSVEWPDDVNAPDLDATGSATPGSSSTLPSTSAG